MPEKEARTDGPIASSIENAWASEYGSGWSGKNGGDKSAWSGSARPEFVATKLRIGDESFAEWKKVIQMFGKWLTKELCLCWL